MEPVKNRALKKKKRDRAGTDGVLKAVIGTKRRGVTRNRKGGAEVTTREGNGKRGGQPRPMGTHLLGKGKKEEVKESAAKDFNLHPES